MLYFMESQWLLWGGIAVMATAAAAAAACMIVFAITGRRIKKKLEEEYGRPQRKITGETGGESHGLDNCRHV